MNRKMIGRLASDCAGILGAVDAGMASGLAACGILNPVVAAAALAALPLRPGDAAVMPCGMESRCWGAGRWCATPAAVLRGNLSLVESLLEALSERLSELAGEGLTRGLLIRLAGEAARRGRTEDVRLLCLAHAVVVLADLGSDANERSWALYYFYLSCGAAAVAEEAVAAAA